MNKFFWNGFCFVAIIVALIIYACANRGYPQGGEKDVTPPQVIKEVPESFSTNFKGKQIDIYFDEYVQLKDINKKFVMSPPMKKKARVSFAGKIRAGDVSGFFETEHDLHAGLCRRNRG